MLFWKHMTKDFNSKFVNKWRQKSSALSFPKGTSSNLTNLPHHHFHLKLFFRNKNSKFQVRNNKTSWGKQGGKWAWKTIFFFRKLFSSSQFDKWIRTRSIGCATARAERKKKLNEGRFFIYYVLFLFWPTKC
jgi:hypothetical protein